MSRITLDIFPDSREEIGDDTLTKILGAARDGMNQSRTTKTVEEEPVTSRVDITPAKVRKGAGNRSIDWAEVTFELDDYDMKHRRWLPAYRKLANDLADALQEQIAQERTFAVIIQSRYCCFDIRGIRGTKMAAPVPITRATRAKRTTATGTKPARSVAKDTAPAVKSTKRVAKRTAAGATAARARKPRAKAGVDTSA